MEQILDILYNTCPPVWGLKQTSKTLGEHHCTENKNSILVSYIVEKRTKLQFTRKKFNVAFVVQLIITETKSFVSKDSWVLSECRALIPILMYYS